MGTADQLELFLHILLALGLGAAVGIERELRQHEAGLRTNALVTMGAAIFGAVSLTFSDDSRVAAGVVQGIGFIGAGLIFQRGQGLVGLTTAATPLGHGRRGLAGGTGAAARRHPRDRARAGHAGAGALD